MPLVPLTVDHPRRRFLKHASMRIRYSSWVISLGRSRNIFNDRQKSLGRGVAHKFFGPNCPFLLHNGLLLRNQPYHNLSPVDLHPTRLFTSIDPSPKLPKAKSHNGPSTQPFLNSPPQPTPDNPPIPPTTPDHKLPPYPLTAHPYQTLGFKPLLINTHSQTPLPPHPLPNPNPTS